MTEEEWLATTTDPAVMLNALRGTASERKLRLFAVACCRVDEDIFYDTFQWHAVEVLERFADGRAGADEVAAAHAAVGGIDYYDPDGLLQAHDTEAEFRAYVTEVILHATSPDAAGVGIPTPTEYARAVIRSAVAVGERMDANFDREFAATKRMRLRDLLRCVFGNPFRCAAFDPRWRTETAVALAAGVYADRAFDRLPILADALEDAGCDSAELLNHCRGHGPHVRGCWVVDLVLGKE